MGTAVHRRFAVGRRAFHQTPGSAIKSHFSLQDPSAAAALPSRRAKALVLLRQRLENAICQTAGAYFFAWVGGDSCFSARKAVSTAQEMPTLAVWRLVGMRAA